MQIKDRNGDVLEEIRKMLAEAQKMREETGAADAKADLYGLDLHRADFTGFGRGELRGVLLSNSDVTYAKLAGMDLRDICGINTYFTGADLRGCDFRGANLRGSVFDLAKMSWCDFRGANLEGVWMRKSDLRGANLMGAIMSRARLEGADLRNCDLRGAKLPKSIVRAATDETTKFDDAQLKQMRQWAMTELARVQMPVQ